MTIENLDTQPTDEQLQAEWDAVAAEREPDATTDTAVDDTAAVESQNTETQAAATPQATPDPLAEFIATQTRAMADLTNQVKQNTGRVATLQSEWAKAGAAAAKATQDAPSQAQVADAAKDPAEWAQLKEDFPEWAVAMDKRLDQKIAASRSAQAPAPALDPAAIDQQVEARVAEQVKQLESARVERVHKGWQNTTKTPEFVAWYRSQPEDVRALGASPLSDDAIDLFNRYNEHRAKSGVAQAQQLQGQRQARLSLASTNKPGTTPAAKSAADMTPDELWNYEAARREKRRQA